MTYKTIIIAGKLKQVPEKSPGQCPSIYYRRVNTSKPI